MPRSSISLFKRIEADLGTRDWFATVAVADARYVLSFDVESPADDQTLMVVKRRPAEPEEVPA